MSLTLLFRKVMTILVGGGAGFVGSNFVIDWLAGVCIGLWSKMLFSSTCLIWKYLHDLGRELWLSYVLWRCRACHKRNEINRAI